MLSGAFPESPRRRQILLRPQQNPQKITQIWLRLHVPSTRHMVRCRQKCRMTRKEVAIFQVAATFAPSLTCELESHDKKEAVRAFHLRYAHLLLPLRYANLCCHKSHIFIPIFSIHSPSVSLVLVLFCTVVVPYDMSFEPPKVTNHEVLFQMLPWVRVEIMLCGSTKGSLSSVIYRRLVLIFEMFPRAWLCGASTLELKFFSYVKWWNFCDFFSLYQLRICKYDFDRRRSRM